MLPTRLLLQRQKLNTMQSSKRLIPGSRCKTFDPASEQKIFCRDIKPDNIVIEGGKTGGRVFLVDFGGVQAAAAGESFALGSTVIGTYGYMAPEQFRGAAQPASDLYGLGGTLLYLLSGALTKHNCFVLPWTRHLTPEQKRFECGISPCEAA